MPGTRTDQGRANILIVDDDLRITDLLADLLPEHNCVQASSVAQALAHMAETEFELILTDITLPGMSGLDLISMVKKNAPHTVVVVVSGMQMMECAIDALRLGAFDYLVKPFDLQQVGAVVRRALEHQELIVAKQQYENRLEELVEQRTRQLDQALDC